MTTIERLRFENLGGKFREARAHFPYCAHVLVQWACGKPQRVPDIIESIWGKSTHQEGGRPRLLMFPLRDRGESWEGAQAYERLDKLSTEAGELLKTIPDVPEVFLKVPSLAQRWALWLHYASQPVELRWSFICSKALLGDDADTFGSNVWMIARRAIDLVEDPFPPAPGTEGLIESLNRPEHSISVLEDVFDSSVVVLQQLLSMAAVERPGSAPRSGYVFKRAGDFWEVRFGAEIGRFSNLKGFSIIHRLLLQPDPATPISGKGLHGLTPELSAVSHSAQVAIDKPGKDSLRDRIQLLLAEKAKAQEEGDVLVIGECNAEIVQIQEELARSSGAFGRPRTLGGHAPGDTARASVRSAINRAVKRICKSCPSLADHLRISIRTEGPDFAYRPSKVYAWDLH